jgi:hypothetical protein
MLRDNLVRNGVDLTVDTNLTYFDVNNRRVGINTTLPTTDLDVNGNVRASSITADSVFINNVFGNTNVLQNLYSDNSIIGNLFVTGNLLIPVGDNNYPVTATGGQIRYNNETNFFEYYDGYTWNKIAKEGDLSAQITSDLFYGNNVANSFTLSQNSTTQGTFVSINGVLQQPGQSYVVSDNILTFISEAPVDTDVIEARAMTVNSQVGKIQNGDNWVSAEYQSDATGIVNIGVDGQYQMQLTANTIIMHSAVLHHVESYAVSSTPVLIDTIDNDKIHACKYTVSGVDDLSNQYHAFESLVIHSDTQAAASQYGDVNIGGTFLTISVNLINNKTFVYLTSSTPNTGSVKISKQYLPSP